MQIAFVATTTRTRGFLRTIRWFVSAYVWLTGLKRYVFPHKDDFRSQGSSNDLRINFFVVFLRCPENGIAYTSWPCTVHLCYALLVLASATNAAK